MKKAAAIEMFGRSVQTRGLKYTTYVEDAIQRRNLKIKKAKTRKQAMFLEDLVKQTHKCYKPKEEANRRFQQQEAGKSNVTANCQLSTLHLLPRQRLR